MNPDDLPPLRTVIAQHDLRADKSLGQNFLLDLNITDKIARQTGDLSDITVFEIGPGPGGLTRSLLKAGAKRVIAIEFDPRAVAALQDLAKAAAGRLDVLHADALKTDLTTLAEGPRAIVANLPYNIATPLLVGWLRQIHENPSAFSSMILMFQKEVAERITAEPGGKTYGRLSVLAQWLCKAHRLFDLPPSAFTPPPKIHSSIVRFIPRTQPEDLPPFEIMEALTAASFGQRRKMIRSSLKDYARIVAEAELNPEVRAENLSVEDFVSLARHEQAARAGKPV